MQLIIQYPIFYLPLPYDIQELIFKLNRKKAFNGKILRLNDKLKIKPMTEFFEYFYSYLYDFYTHISKNKIIRSFYVLRYERGTNTRYVLHNHKPAFYY